jgi:hypothetical protein
MSGKLVFKESLEKFLIPFPPARNVLLGFTITHNAGGFGEMTEWMPDFGLEGKNYWGWAGRSKKNKMSLVMTRTLHLQNPYNSCSTTHTARQPRMHRLKLTRLVTLVNNRSGRSEISIEVSLVNLRMSSMRAW